MSNLVFAKAHALGNDFVLIKSNEVLEKEQIKFIANRKLGIGCDQVLIINDDNHVKIWNQDGSLAKMCMNGLRALGKWIEDDISTFKTDSGIIETKKFENEILLTPNFAKINKIDDVFLVDVGNLHKIFVIENAPGDLAGYQDDEFNISFLWVENNLWNARTIERGVGETLACGSAAFAMANVLNSLNETDLNVNFSLGTIKHIKENNQIKQLGPAEIIATGNLIINL